MALFAHAGVNRLRPLRSVVIFFKMAILKKYFGEFMRHISRLNAGKKIKYIFFFSFNEKLIKLFSDSFQIEVYSSYDSLF